MSDAGNGWLDDLLGKPPGNGQTLDQLISELVGWYGADAVRDATARLAKKRRGRTIETDLSEITYTVEQDAIDWLNGLDPFKLRSNYSIAKNAASANPGHSYDATFRRFMGELAKCRVPMVYNIAAGFSLVDYPFGMLFRAEQALASIDSWMARAVAGLANDKRNLLDQYQELLGTPDPELTWPEISAAVDAHSKIGS